MTAEHNQFGFFSEIEEYFWRKRGAHILVSPLDWAILETWQKAGIPVQAVLNGIDSAFESYARSKRAAGGRALKSLAYCVDAVLDAAERWKEAHAGESPAVPSARAKDEATFSREALAQHLSRTGEKLRSASGKCSARLPQLAAKLADAAIRTVDLAPLLDAPGAIDVEDLERRLTVIEEKLAAALLSDAEDEAMLDVRREMDHAMAPYRRRMKAEQLATVERQFLQKRLFEKYDVPRLSLFYMT